MSFAFDNKTEISVAGKIDSQLDLGDRCDINNIRRIAAEGAIGVRACIGWWHASNALEEGEINTRRVIGSVAADISGVGMGQRFI